MAKGYTTKTKVETFLNTTISINIDDYIETAENIIDMLTGRNFIADTTDVVRYYSGCGSKVLLIDDAVEITKVEIGDDDYGGSFTEINEVSSSDASGYFTMPENFSEDGEPITKLILRSHKFLSGIKNQKITGKWGYSVNVPADICFAATVIAGGIYNTNYGGAVASKLKSEKIGNYSVSYGVDDEASWASFKRAVQIISNYKKWAL